MKDQEKTKASLVEEAAGLRQRVAALETALREREERLRGERTFQREEALGRIRDRITALRSLSEVPGELEKSRIEELRRLGLSISAVSLHLPAKSPGYFTRFQAAFCPASQPIGGKLADAPWIEEAWKTGRPVVVEWEALNQAGVDTKIQHLVEIPLPGGGSLEVTSLAKDAFDEEAIYFLQRFASLLASSLPRLCNFEDLCQAEESLLTDVVLQRVRNEVLQMQTEADWEKVVRVFHTELRKRVAFDYCSVNLIDRKKRAYDSYGMTPGGSPTKRSFQTLPPTFEHILEIGTLVYRRTREEIEQWGDLVGPGVRAIVDVPFSGGTFAISSQVENVYSARDLQVLEQFAPTLSEGHRRLEDLKALAVRETQLRQMQKLEAVGQLATGVSHEINNPLTSVIGYSELVLGRELDPQVRQHVEIIYQEGQRAARIVAELLRFTQRQQGNKQWQPLNLLVHEALGLVRQSFEVGGVQLREELAEDLPLVEVQAGQLQQVVLGLVQNSREAILQAKQGSRVTVRTSSADGGVRLEVEDDGPGIPEAIRERIFEPFFTTKKVGQGPGLGLSLCFAIAREHGGRLWIEPREPGALVVLELPTDQMVSSAQIHPQI